MGRIAYMVKRVVLLKKYVSKNRVSVSITSLLSLAVLFLAISLISRTNDRNDYRDSYLSAVSSANSKDTEIESLESEIYQLKSDSADSSNGSSTEIEELNAKIELFDDAIRKYFQRDFDNKFYACENDPNITLPKGLVIKRTVDECKESVLRNYSTSWAESQ